MQEKRAAAVAAAAAAGNLALGAPAEEEVEMEPPFEEAGEDAGS